MRGLVGGRVERASVCRRARDGCIDREFNSDRQWLWVLWVYTDVLYIKL